MLRGTSSEASCVLPLESQLCEVVRAGLPRPQWEEPALGDETPCCVAGQVLGGPLNVLQEEGWQLPSPSPRVSRQGLRTQKGPCSIRALALRSCRRERGSGGWGGRMSPLSLPSTWHHAFPLLWAIGRLSSSWPQSDTASSFYLCSLASSVCGCANR